jgi:hypothetical protein
MTAEGEEGKGEMMMMMMMMEKNTKNLRGDAS